MLGSFIQVNNTIQDYSEYMKNVLLLKRYAEKRIIETLAEEGFVPEKVTNPRYHEATIELYNKEKDLKIRIDISKRGEEVFV